MWTEFWHLTSPKCENQLALGELPLSRPRGRSGSAPGRLAAELVGRFRLPPVLSLPLSGVRRIGSDELERGEQVQKVDLGVVWS